PPPPILQSTVVCILVDFLLELAIYSNFVQEHLAPANYIKIPTDLDNYKKGCKFLPKLNNEIHTNSTYKERFSSLQNLVLIMFEKDRVLVPKETSWFGYYPDGSWSTVLPAQETTLYSEDWIGVKALDEAGKVKFLKASGHHLEIFHSEMKDYILPYLVENGQRRLPDSYHVQPFSGFKEASIKLYTSH
ncbi:palmitoyl-protein thioesterase 1-like, partial [Olea europaea var. sylvestris]|uniref:palmitoyl-protein thioesterase 1-like n=1 Tax=Olea europaea var. sylvestris TaxID=158386 RepID=UPI000C1D7B6E